MTVSSKFDNLKLPILLALPQILIVLVWFYWPTIQAIWWGFTLEPPFGGSRKFVGLDNIRSILANPSFIKTLRVTFIFTIASSLISITLAFFLAMFVDYVVKGRKLYRLLCILPYTLAAPLIGAVWVFILQPNIGFISALNRSWPGFWDPTFNSSHAMILIIVAFVWRMVSYSFIFFVAGFQAIPQSLNEAAAMGGASPWQRYRDIYIPLLTPTFFYIGVITIIETLTRTFGIIDSMTKGGPAGLTTNIVYKIYSDGFIGLDFSGASAQSILLMIFLIGISIIQFKYIDKKIHYNS